MSVPPRETPDWLGDLFQQGLIDLGDAELLFGSRQSVELSRAKLDTVQRIYERGVDALEAALETRSATDAIATLVTVAADKLRIRRMLPRPLQKYCWNFPPTADSAWPEQISYWATTRGTEFATVRANVLTGYPIIRCDEGDEFCANEVAESLLIAGWPCRLYEVFPLQVGTGYHGVVECEVRNIDDGEETLRLRSVEDFTGSLRLLNEFVVHRELDAWRVFGPNGRQVAAAIAWWRNPRSRDAKDVQREIRASYRRHAKLRWPSGPPVYRYSDDWRHSCGFEAQHAWRASLFGRYRMASAWVEALDLAIKEKRFFAAS